MGLISASAAPHCGGQELRRNQVQLGDIPQDTPATQEPAPVPPAAATPNNKTPVVKQHQPTQAKPAAAKEANTNTPYITLSGSAIHPPAKLTFDYCVIERLG